MLAQFVKEHRTDLENVARAVRCLGMDAVLKAKSGHVGLPLGGAEMGTLLYFAAMNHAPAQPHWADRDRFVLSAGHGSMLQYALLHLAGYDLPLDDIVHFRQLGSKTPGHPEFGHTAGVECTTGPLGQGIANAVGMALAERMLAARLNSPARAMVDHRTYVILGDGCMMEGVSGEACSLAGHLKLNRLIALYDANNITIDGTVDISFTENVKARYLAYGWNVLEADGNSFESLATALDVAHAHAAQGNGRTGPTLIVCKGVAGKGSPKWEGKPKIHGNPMSAEDVVEAKKHLGVENVSPFHVPEEWRASARRLVGFRVQKAARWHEDFEKALATDSEFAQRWQAHFDPASAVDALPDAAWALAQGKAATRQSGGKALVAFAQADSRLVGGSADLAGSNATTLPGSTFIHAEDFSGRNIHFGVREHGMGAIINGMALHGGLRPYCATFTVFSDYMRPPIRLAALMNIPSLFILTHDSFAVGEDGPTHQPVEHAASLRAIPNLQVFRPADTLETFAAWEAAMATRTHPTALLLTRQDVPDLDAELAGLGQPPRARADVQNAMQQGAYLLKDFDGARAAQKLVLIASGSEVSAALGAARLIESQTFETLSGEKLNVTVRVVSAPAPQCLAANPVTLNRLVPKDVPAVAIEAGSGLGWGDIVGRDGAVFAMPGFGASAPAETLTAHFGFTPAALAARAAIYLRVRPKEA